MKLDPDLNSAPKYLSTGTFDKAFSKIARSIKIRAKNYLMLEENLYWLTAKGLRFRREENTLVLVGKLD